MSKSTNLRDATIEEARRHALGADPSDESRETRFARCLAVVGALADVRAEDLARERERTTALRASLERFGRHEDTCTYRWEYEGSNLRCSCGLHAALAPSLPADPAEDEDTLPTVEEVQAIFRKARDE